MAETDRIRRKTFVEIFFLARRHCPICGGEMEKSKGPVNPNTATVDHIIPLSAGGEDEPWNWIVMCRYCNEQKAAKPIEDLLSRKAFVGRMPIPTMEQYVQELMQISYPQTVGLTR